MQSMKALIALVFWISISKSPIGASAQFKPLASSGERSVLLVNDSLWVIDTMALTAHNAGRPEWLDAFDITTLPSTNSGAWDEENEVFWLWDNSVGATIRLSSSGETISFIPRRSSHVQYEHAGGLHPIDRVPIAYSGYGYYRTKEFMVSFSPEADTWVEVPYIGPMPDPRMGAIMISGFESPHVLVTGGRKAERDTYPPVYNLETEDAWEFDFETLEWNALPFEPWLTCGLRFTRGLLGDVPVQGEETLIFFPDQCSMPFETDFQVSNGIVSWNAFTGEVRLLGMVENLPTPFRLVGLYLDAVGLPVVTVSNTEPDTWVASLFHPDIRPIEASVIRMQVPKERSLIWIFPVIVVLLGGIVWLWVYRRVTVTVDSDRGVLVFKRGLTSHVTTPSPSVIQLALAFASSSSKSRFPGDLVSDHFDSLIADPDASRVAKNRALNDINELSESLGLGALIDRKRNSADKRKFDYTSPASFKRVS